jgi:hypothetical protein
MMEDYPFAPSSSKHSTPIFSSLMKILIPLLALNQGHRE